MLIGIIPARYGSTRLPGKPLLAIAGKPMIVHVCERALEAGCGEGLLATDDLDDAGGGVADHEERAAEERGDGREVAVVVADDSDEDIDAVDTIDPDLFPIFEEEATELMPQLGGALRQWSAQPDQAGPRLDVLRVLHTLKGSARLAGAMRLGEMAHRMESAIEQMGSEFIQASQIEPMLTRFDRLQQVFDELCHGPSEAPVAAPVAESYPAPQPASEAMPVTDMVPDTASRPVPAARPVMPAPTQARMAAPATSPAANARLEVTQASLWPERPRIGQALEQIKALEKEVAALKGKLASAQGDELVGQAVDVEIDQPGVIQPHGTQPGVDGGGVARVDAIEARIIVRRLARAFGHLADDAVAAPFGHREEGEEVPVVERHVYVVLVDLA